MVGTDIFFCDSRLKIFFWYNVVCMSTILASNLLYLLQKSSQFDLNLWPDKHGEWEWNGASMSLCKTNHWSKVFLGKKRTSTLFHRQFFAIVKFLSWTTYKVFSSNLQRNFHTQTFRYLRQISLCYPLFAKATDIQCSRCKVQRLDHFQQQKQTWYKCWVAAVCVTCLTCYKVPNLVALHSPMFFSLVVHSSNITLL